MDIRYNITFLSNGIYEPLTDTRIGGDVRSLHNAVSYTLAYIKQQNFSGTFALEDYETETVLIDFYWNHKLKTIKCTSTGKGFST